MGKTFAERIDDNRRWILGKLKKNADVNCAGCTLCCKSGHKIFLYPEAGDAPHMYHTVADFDAYWGSTRHRLAQRPSGACIYLSEKGCEVHKFRPMACRAFSCIDQYAMFKPEDIRLLKRQRKWKPEHAEGERRWKEINGPPIQAA